MTEYKLVVVGGKYELVSGLSGVPPSRDGPTSMAGRRANHRCGGRYRLAGSSRLGSVPCRTGPRHPVETPAPHVPRPRPRTIVRPLTTVTVLRVSLPRHTMYLWPVCVRSAHKLPFVDKTTLPRSSVNQCFIPSNRFLGILTVWRISDYCFVFGHFKIADYSRIVLSAQPFMFVLTGPLFFSYSHLNLKSILFNMMIG